MKNYLFSCLTFSLLFMFTASLQAQVKIGLRAGLNLATLQGLNLDGNANIESFPRLTVMVPVEIPMADFWSLQPELGFTQKGLKVGYQEANSSAELTYQLNYIDINLLGKVTLGSPLVQWGFLAGPSLNYGTNAKLISKTNLNGNPQKEEEKLIFGENGLRKMDFGLQLGTFLQAPLPGASVFIDARYHLGLMNISTEPDADPVSNRGLQLSTGFLIPISK